MISEVEIQRRLNQYVMTEAGKRKIDACIREHRQTGRPLANGEIVIGPKEMTEMADALIGMIQRRIPEAIAQAGQTLRSTQPVKRADGSYRVEVRFDKAALHRDSLENDLGYEGIDNIVALFNNGYHAKNYVYGWWDGHSATGDGVLRSGPSGDFAWVKSRREREPLLFMQEAVDEFNTVYGDRYHVVVDLASDYIKD